MLNLNSWYFDPVVRCRPVDLPHPMGKEEAKYYWKRRQFHRPTYHYLIERYSTQNLAR